MTSIRQIEANRRNARKSTGPLTEEGKQRSRCNAVRHGVTAETVISALEDAEDHQAFEATIIADYDAQSAVERELVLRLASVLWRLRQWKPACSDLQAHHLAFGPMPSGRYCPGLRALNARIQTAARHHGSATGRICGMPNLVTVMGQTLEVTHND